ncbi:MAG: hypothetical protein JWQ71_5081 [Pedosphaera sp.]|nr:hypothetical protein [Pedosphaera sp.]
MVFDDSELYYSSIWAFILFCTTFVFSFITWSLYGFESKRQELRSVGIALGLISSIAGVATLAIVFSLNDWSDMNYTGLIVALIQLVIGLFALSPWIMLKKPEEIK